MATSYADTLNQLLKEKTSAQLADLAQKKADAEAQYFSDPSQYYTDYADIRDPNTRLDLINNRRKIDQSNAVKYATLWSNSQQNLSDLVDKLVQARTEAANEAATQADLAYKQASLNASNSSNKSLFDASSYDVQNYALMQQQLGTAAANAWLKNSMGITSNSDGSYTIKNTDGTTTTYDSNGNIVKPTTSSSSSPYSSSLVSAGLKTAAGYTVPKIAASLLSKIGADAAASSVGGPIGTALGTTAGIVMSLPDIYNLYKAATQ